MVRRALSVWRTAARRKESNLKSPAWKRPTDLQLYPIAYTRKALIHKHAAAMADEELAVGFNSHVPDFISADIDFVDLLEGFGEPTCLLQDHLSVDLDDGRAEKLVEAVFEQVIIRFAECQVEFHKT